jgi:AraC family transcriptional activator of pobA
MSTPSTPIPKFELSPLAKAGIAVKELHANKLPDEHRRDMMHRDNHYLMMVALEGTFRLSVDFKEINFRAPATCTIHPGQVHCLLNFNLAKGWAISFDPLLIDAQMQHIFEQATIKTPIIRMMDNSEKDIISIMQMMHKYQDLPASPIHTNIVHALLAVLLGIISVQVTLPKPLNKPTVNRSAVIEQSFMDLLKAHFKIWKSPSRYADELAISVAHLNAVIKTATGETVSAHIQETSVLEAKRLLCFTALSIKEIGYEAGYNEPVYFGKLFRKVTGMTPVQFRKQFRV